MKKPYVNESKVGMLCEGTSHCGCHQKLFNVVGYPLPNLSYVALLCAEHDFIQDPGQQNKHRMNSDQNPGYTMVDIRYYKYPYENQSV